MDQEAAALKQQALREENRKIRYLRFLVDLGLQEIRAGRFTRPQAEKVVENIRSQALKLFPGKEEAFDLIYRPRFQRAITEVFQLH
ncbi:MAG: hypothetical protein AB1491_05490 [Thermodesulfobacteriota bacterium]